MPETLTIQFLRPLAGIHVHNAAGEACAGRPATGGEEDHSRSPQTETTCQADRAHATKEIEQQKGQFAELCRTAGAMVENLDKLYQDTLDGNRSDIARLAVEIARKILMHKVAQGDYDIQAIIEEALKRAPTRQNIVIRLNPEDLPHCRQIQQENPDGLFARLELTADRSIGRGECMVETPKGIVKSFIEEHLERISEALRKVEE